MTTPRTWKLKVANEDGQHLFTVLLSRDRTTGGVSALAGAATPSQPAATGRQNGGNEPRMTEPQKRYLFRLLAQQGVDGKNAEERLKQLFQVRQLREVTKAAA